MRIALWSIALFISAGCASVPRARSIASLRAESELYVNAGRFKSADSITRFFADSVIVMSLQARQPVRGKEANRLAWQRFFSGSNPEHTMTTDSVVIDRAGHMGYTIGQWTVGIDAPTGRSTARGHYLAVWERRADRWLITAITAYPFR